MVQKNILETDQYIKVVSQWGPLCDKHTKSKSLSWLSRRFYPAKHRISAGTWNRWKVSSFLLHIVLPPSRVLLIFPLQEWQVFSSLSQVSLVIILKKTKAKTLVLWLRPHLTLTERLRLGTDRQNDLGDTPASRFRESIVVLSCKTTRIPSSLHSSDMYMHSYWLLSVSACLLVHLALNHDEQRMRLYRKPRILLQSRHLQVVSSFTL